MIVNMRIRKAILVVLVLQAIADAFIIPRGPLSHSHVRRFATDSGLSDAEAARAKLRQQVQEAEARRKRLQEEMEANKRQEEKGRQKLQSAISDRESSRRQLRQASGGADIFPVAGLTLGAIAYGRNVLEQRRKKVEEDELEQFQKKLEKERERRESADNRNFILAVSGAAAIASSSFDKDVPAESNRGFGGNTIEQFSGKKAKAGDRTELPYLEQKIKKAETEVKTNRLLVEEAEKKAKLAASELESGEQARLLLQKQLEDAEQKVAKETAKKAEEAAKKAAAEKAASEAAAKAAKELAAKEAEIR